jgi:hypothetical protein
VDHQVRTVGVKSLVRTAGKGHHRSDLQKSEKEILKAIGLLAKEQNKKYEKRHQKGEWATRALRGLCCGLGWKILN